MARSRTNPVSETPAETPEAFEQEVQAFEVLDLPEAPEVDAETLVEVFNLGDVDDDSKVEDLDTLTEDASDYIAYAVEARDASVGIDNATLRAAHAKMRVRLGITYNAQPDFAGKSLTYLRLIGEGQAKGIESMIWQVPADATPAQKTEHNQRKSRVNASIRKQLERVVMEGAILGYWIGDSPHAAPASVAIEANPDLARSLKWTPSRIAADGFTTHPAVLATAPQWAKAEIARIYERAGITVPMKYGGPDPKATTPNDAGPGQDGGAVTPENTGSVAANLASDPKKVTDVEAATMALRVLSAVSVRQAGGEVKDRERVAAIWDRIATVADLSRKAIHPEHRPGFTEEDLATLQGNRWDPQRDGAVKTATGE